MKKIFFTILVIFLTPVYLIICLFNFLFNWITDITEPIAEGISDLVDNMTEFWKKLFERREKNEFSKKS